MRFEWPAHLIWAFSNSARIVLGMTRCPRYIFAAHAACVPVKFFRYASMKWSEQVENLGGKLPNLSDQISRSETLTDAWKSMILHPNMKPHSFPNRPHLMMQVSDDMPVLQPPSIAQWSWAHNGTLAKTIPCNLSPLPLFPKLTPPQQNQVDWTVFDGNSNVSCLLDSPRISYHTEPSISELLQSHAPPRSLPSPWIGQHGDEWGHLSNKRPALCHLGVYHF